MKTGPLIHGVLLAGALVVAYQSWTKEEKEDPTTGDFVVWQESKDAFTSIHFEAEKKSVSVEKRNQDGSDYLWGTVKRTTKKPKAKTDQVAPDAATDAPEENPLPAPDEFTVTTREFPVGEKGDEFLDAISEMRALRQLGQLDQAQKEKYGLADSKENLTVNFGDGNSRTLVIGNRVYGGSHRYASDATSGESFVLSSDIMRPIDSAESSLGLKKIHLYEDKDVTGAVVETSKTTKTALKKVTEDPEKGKKTTWSWSDTPDKDDLTIANFLDRAGKLKPVRYDTEVDVATLDKIATVKYQGEKGDLGFMEVYRQLPKNQKDDPKNPSKVKRTEYFVKTERTRSLGKASRMSAERVDQDLVELFGIEAPPKPPAEPKKAVPKAAPKAPPGFPGAPGKPAGPAGKTAPKTKAPAAKPPSAPGGLKDAAKSATQKAKEAIKSVPGVPKPSN